MTRRVRLRLIGAIRNDGTFQGVRWPFTNIVKQTFDEFQLMPR